MLIWQAMKSILVVDDEIAICAEVETTLSQLGFETKAAHTVETALKSMEGVQFDLILLEFNLRSQNKTHPRTGAGLQIVRHLRASGLPTPVLIYTAMNGNLYEEASFEAGADDFISKTSGIGVLLSHIRAHALKPEQKPFN